MPTAPWPPGPPFTSALAYRQSFSVGTPDAGSVTRGTLIRLSSVTHTFNQSQHIYPLKLSRSASSATTLTGVAPRDGIQAPPGPYMLFLVNAKGVPSVARTVRVGP
jgi:galactose oxidase